MAISEEIDPERFVLTKSEVIEYLKLIKKRWEKNRLKNAPFIAFMDGMISITYVAPEGWIKKFWGEVLKLFHFLYTQNIFEISTKEGTDSENFKKLKRLALDKMQKEVEEPLKDV